MWWYLIIAAVAALGICTALVRRTVHAFLAWRDDDYDSVFIAARTSGLAFTVALLTPFYHVSHFWTLIVSPFLFILATLYFLVFWEAMFTRIFDPRIERLAARVRQLHDDYKFHRDLERD
jgi:hypothetical protein